MSLTYVVKGWFVDPKVKHIPCGDKPLCNPTAPRPLGFRVSRSVLPDVPLCGMCRQRGEAIARRLP